MYKWLVVLVSVFVVLGATATVRAKDATQSGIRVKAENVSTRLCNAQAKRVEKLTEHLQRMSGIVDRVENKVAELEKTGKNVTGVRKDIADARTAVTAARTAVKTFSGKDCGLNLTGTEFQLKAELGSAVKDLEIEFRTLQIKLTEARLATAKAIRALAVLNNEEVR